MAAEREKKGYFQKDLFVIGGFIIKTRELLTVFGFASIILSMSDISSAQLNWYGSGKTGWL